MLTNVLTKCVVSGLLVAGLCPWSFADSQYVAKEQRVELIAAADEDARSAGVSQTPLQGKDQAGLVRSAAAGNLATPSLYEYSTFQFEETRARFGVGPAFNTFGKETRASQLDLFLHYRISPKAFPVEDRRPWRLGPMPLELHLELGVMALPKNLQFFKSNINADDYDYASARLQSIAHLAIVDVLPHGEQHWIAPELGAGISLATVDYSGYSSAGSPYFEQTKNDIAPYFVAGLTFFPDHVVSFSIRGANLRLPAPGPIHFAAGGFLGTVPAHSFDPPWVRNGFSIQSVMSVKLMWPELVHAPFLPQMMPPWLLGSYTTEPISPWVATPSVQEHFQQPGGTPVGNVFFQYKNRWAKSVQIIGDFNDWQPERMIKDRSGVWVAVKDLPVGRFRYNYVVNGHREITDPWNKNTDPSSREHGSSLVGVGI